MSDTLQQGIRATAREPQGIEEALQRPVRTLNQRQGATGDGREATLPQQCVQASLAEGPQVSWRVVMEPVAAKESGLPAVQHGYGYQHAPTGTQQLVNPSERRRRILEVLEHVPERHQIKGAGREVEREQVPRVDANAPVDAAARLALRTVRSVPTASNPSSDIAMRKSPPPQPTSSTVPWLGRSRATRRARRLGIRPNR